MTTEGALRQLSPRGSGGMPPTPTPRKNLKSQARKCDFQRCGIKKRAVDGYLLFFLLILFLFSFLFSLMKFKQTAVGGPTGDGRPPVTGFY